MRKEGAAGLRRFPAMETSIYPDLHLSVLPLLPRHLRGFDAAHVHTPGPLGLAAILASRRADVPAVYTYHTRFDDAIPHLAPTQGTERLLTAGASRLDRFIARRVGALVAPTPALAAELERRLGVPCEAIPNGVDLDRFRPLARPANGAPTFLHLGRLAPEKNVGALRNAFRLVLRARPDAKLRVAGSGPDAARLRRLADDLGLGSSVEWPGFVSEEDLPRADVPVFGPLGHAGAATLADPDDAPAFAAAMLRAYDEEQRSESGVLLRSHPTCPHKSYSNSAPAKINAGADSFLDGLSWIVRTLNPLTWVSPG